MNKQTFSQFVQSLDNFLTWMDENTIIVNGARYWKDAEDYISNPLSYNDIILEYEKRYIQRYVVADREAGNVIDSGLSLDEAEMRIVDYEESDKRDGVYVPNFYEIKKQD